MMAQSSLDELTEPEIIDSLTDSFINNYFIILTAFNRKYWPSLHKNTTAKPALSSSMMFRAASTISKQRNLRRDRFRLRMRTSVDTRQQLVCASFVLPNKLLRLLCGV